MAFSRSLRLAIQFFTYLTHAIFLRQLKSRSFRRILLLPAILRFGPKAWQRGVARDPCLVPRAPNDKSRVARPKQAHHAAGPKR